MWSIRRGCFKQLIRTTRSSELRAEPQWRGAMIDRIKPGNFKCIQTCKKGCKSSNESVSLPRLICLAQTTDCRESAKSLTFV